MTRHSFATTLHIESETAWDFAAGYLSQLTGEMDIFITCPMSLQSAIAALAETNFPTASVIGIDGCCTAPLPLLALCKKHELNSYKAVLNLSPKTPEPLPPSHPGRHALDLLAGSTAALQMAKNQYIIQPDTGIIGPAVLARGAQSNMGDSRSTLEALLQHAGIDLIDWPVFLEPVCWFPSSALHLFKNLPDAVTLPALANLDSPSTQTALSLFLAALPAALGTTPFVFEKSAPETGSLLLLPLREHGPCNDLRMKVAAPEAITDRILQAQSLCETVTASPLFDIKEYTARLSGKHVPGMDPLYHFVLYGDLLSLDPCPHFSTDYYLLSNPDAVASNTCSLAHFIQQDASTAVLSPPTEQDWLGLAEQLDLFSEEWYVQQYPDVGHSGLSPRAHYQAYGRLMGRASHPHFSPAKIPVLHGDQEAGVVEFVKHHYRTEQAVYAALERAANQGDTGLSTRMDFRLRSQYGDTTALQAARATALSLNNHWDQARQEWAAYWAQVEAGSGQIRHKHSLVQFNHRADASYAHFESASSTALPVSSPATAPAKVCIYTTLFGDIDDLLPVLFPGGGIDYICFTDRERNTPGWRQIIANPGQTNDTLNAKTFKILPHRYLAEYDYSMFVDANTLFLGRIEEFVEFCKANGDFVMWRHPYRTDLFLESCAIIGHGRHEPEAIISQISHYAEQGIEKNSGLFEASFIWRRHGAEDVRAFMEKWWAEIMAHSSRDQISLGYLVWRETTRPKVIPESLGTSRHNPYFFKIQHKPPTPEEPLLCAPSPPAKERDIAFLYNPRFKETGSTILRGQQLSQMVSTHYGTKRWVSYTDNTDLDGKIVILTKGFLKSTSPEQLRDLASRNILVADFVDEPPQSALVDEVHALMASSLCGYRNYLLKYPHTPSFHITHHVDTRIPPHWRQPKASFDAGYFGEMSNTVKDDDIAAYVAFNQVDTSRQTQAWMDAIGKYSFHYAFRKSRDIDGDKPFLKGFVAAHCGANMLIQNAAGDALYYLGNEYPYLLPRKATRVDIKEKLLFAHDSFLGPEWKFGLEIMEEIRKKSSNQHILAEFSQMIDQL
jgi:hypothetical protein